MCLETGYIAYAYVEKKAMVIVNEQTTVDDIDEALSHVAETMKQGNTQDMQATIDALLDARLGATCD